jgi:hypothetical protein
MKVRESYRNEDWENVSTLANESEELFPSFSDDL